MVGRICFRTKTLCRLLVAFLLGWFSAKMGNQFPSIRGRERLPELFACAILDPVVKNSVVSSQFSRKERFSCRNEERDRRELLRRRTIKTVGYTRNVMLANLRNMRRITDSTGDVEHLSVLMKPLINSTVKLLEKSTSYLLANLHQIEGLEGMNTGRKEALNRLSSLVQTRIKILQSPPDCTRAKILLADLNWGCGYGCHAHYLMFCLNMAYATGRTLVLQSFEKDYSKWWSESYMPLSDECSMDSVSGGDVIVDMNSTNFNGSARVMHCGYEFSFHSQNVPVAPPAVPKDLAPSLLTLHGQPAIWFLGQLAQYLMRPRSKFKSQLDQLALSNKLSRNHDAPIVGVHVRRTDKVRTHEAEFHSLSEYMVHVERYFDYIDKMRSLKNGENRSNGLRVQRQIYLASDDPNVFKDMKMQYPQYIVHSTTKKKLTELAGGMYPTDWRTHIAMEIFQLSLTDYIVCTLSSNVCRLAYELMQSRQGELGDAAELVQTIDTSYFWYGGQVMTCEMVEDDESVNLHKGDVVDIWSDNLNSAFEKERLKNKTYFLDPPYNCALRVMIS